jgi:glycosyltransferase involved in cell wall biosynthesis
MKILIIAKGFYPLISPRSFRATELAKELVKQGHYVKVVTFFDDAHEEFSKETGVVFSYLPSTKWKEININGGKVLSTFKRVIGRLSNLLIEYPGLEIMKLVKNYINNESSHYDAIISIAVPYPNHWGVAASNWKNIADKWIADCGDPYYGDTSDSFRKLFYFKYIEKWSFKKTDAITIPIEEAKKGYFPEFHSKMHVIPQGFDFSIKKSEYIKNEIPTFIYAGGFIPGYRDPQPLLKYLSTIKKDFKFIIYTNKPNLVKPFFGKLKTKLEIRKYIPREELMLELSCADFLVNIDNKERVQAPSKLIDYKIADRPILNIEYGEVNTKLVDEFLNGNYQNQYVLKDFEKYDIKNVTKEFINLINKL